MTINGEKVIRTDEEQKKSVAMYNSFRDELYKRQLSNSEAYDRAILSLSSAGLAMSLSFIKFIVPFEKAEYLDLLKISWFLFLLSIVITLFSFLVGNKGISFQLRHAKLYYVDAISDSFNKFNLYQRINSWLNFVAGLFFVFAITSIVAFVIFNINHG